MAYNNHNSINKEQSRQHILDLIDRKWYWNIFTLPSTNFILEQDIIDKLENRYCNIVCAEHDFEIFQESYLLLKLF